MHDEHEHPHNIRAETIPGKKKNISEWCPDWTQYPLNHPVGEDIKCSVSALQDHLRSSNEPLQKPHQERRERGDAP